MVERIWTVDDHLAQGSDAMVELWWQVRAAIESFGPTSLAVSKTTVTFKGSRRGFAGASPRKDDVVGYFDIMRIVGEGDPRIRRVAPYGRNLFVHQFRLTDAAQLGDEFVGWLGEAFAVGAGAHLLR